MSRRPVAGQARIGNRVRDTGWWCRCRSIENRLESDVALPQTFEFSMFTRMARGLRSTLDSRGDALFGEDERMVFAVSAAATF